MSKVKTVKNAGVTDVVEMFSPEGQDVSVKTENEIVPVILTKAGAITTTLWDGNDGLTIHFAHGKSLTLRVTDLVHNIITQSTLHGLKQKLVDAAAIARNRDTGRSATLDDKFAAVKEVFDRITGAGGEAPSWNIVAKGPGSAPTGGMLLAALCALKPEKTTAQLREWLEKQDTASKSALRNNPRVIAEISRLKAQNAKNTQGIDTDELLDSF